MDGYQKQLIEVKMAKRQFLELLYLIFEHIGDKVFDKFRFEANFMNVFSATK